MKFANINEASKWAWNMDLQVCRDRGDPESESNWLQTLEDRRVGIFGTDLSPNFATPEELLAWINQNWERVEDVLYRAGETSWRAVEKDVAGLVCA